MVLDAGRSDILIGVGNLTTRGDPGFYRYMDGQVGVMSWRRGQWEDLTAADATGGDLLK